MFYLQLLCLTPDSIITILHNLHGVWFCLLLLTVTSSIKEAALDRSCGQKWGDTECRQKLNGEFSWKTSACKTEKDGITLI
jgi:hypothetical protein